MKLFVYNLREFDERQYFDHFSQSYGYEYTSTAAFPTLENTALAKGCDAISIIPCRMDAPLLDKFHALGVKYISTRSIGYEHIDIAHAHKLGMRASNARYSPDSVANYAILMMLMVCRNIVQIIDQARLQNYTLRGKIGRELSQCTIGVLGTGRIGCTVLKHLHGFGSRLLAYSVHQNEEAKRYATYVDFDTFLAECDIISIHTQFTQGTYHLINATTIQKMKDKVIIVNTARGALIDSKALIQGIESGKIGGAALDVLENEQDFYSSNKIGAIIKNHDLAILRSFPNVILTPHTAFYTDNAIRSQIESTYKSIHDFEAGIASQLEIL